MTRVSGHSGLPDVRRYDPPRDGDTGKQLKRSVTASRGSFSPSIARRTPVNHAQTDARGHVRWTRDPICAEGAISSPSRKDNDRLRLRCMCALYAVARCGMRPLCFCISRPSILSFFLFRSGNRLAGAAYHLKAFIERSVCMERPRRSPVGTGARCFMRFIVYCESP